MSFAAAVTAGFALCALSTAIFQFWLYWLRPREPAHLWLAVASIGVAWIAAGYAMVYEGQTLAEAQRGQLVAFGGALPVVVGFLRFTSAFLHVRIEKLERVCGIYTTAALAVAWAQPPLFFSGTGVQLIGPFGQRYVQASLAPTAGFFLIGFAAMIVAAISIYARRWRTLEGGRHLTVSLALWCGFMANDLCVAFGVYRGPWLTGLGFGLFAGAFGAILLGRLVRALGHVERSAGELHRLVEARTDELRRKDLELAHGARLATLGALAGGIAHEIDEPLETVSAHVKELRLAWRDPSRPVAFHELLAPAQRGVERIRAVVSELLQLARREEGREGVHDLPTIVAGVLPIAHYELRRRARLETHFVATPPVRGDASMLAQIALNLLVGALGAIPEGQAERHRISLSTGEAEGRARLVVADSAPGIPGDFVPQLFDSFAAGATGDQRRLGLAVAHRLVQRHGGTLSIESGPAGTRVTVEFASAAGSGGAP